MMRAHGWRKTAYHILLWLIALIFFAPILWIIVAAFKSTSQIVNPAQFLVTPTLENFQAIATDQNAGRFLLNSAVLSVTSVLIAIAVSFMAAYAFSRFNPPGSNFMMFTLLSIRMVPAVAVVIPLYLMYNAFGWRNQPLAMIAFYAVFSIPFSVWILKGFVDGVSKRFDETALVNGGSRWHAVFHVILPQVGPGLVAAFIFNLIFVWNEFLFNLLLGGRDVTNIPVSFSTDLYSDGGMNWTFISAMTTVYMIPPVLIIYIFQKYLLVGMTFGTVRGEV